MPPIKTIFITGATGFIGTGVTKELIAHGYQITGLARSDKSAKKLIELGGQPLQGTIEDIEILKKGAREADAVIHLGFIHKWDEFDRSLRIDRAAITAMLDELVGTGKTFVYTTGTLRLGSTPGVPSRQENKDFALSYSSKGVRVLATLLSPTVHGPGDPNFVPVWVGLAKKNGVANYIEGDHVWPAVNVYDTASLYRLILENGIAGQAYVAAAENVEIKDIAAAIAKTLDIPLKSVSSEEAQTVFGPLFAKALVVGKVEEAKETRALGWKPTHTTLVEDLSGPIYFS